MVKGISEKQSTEERSSAMFKNWDTVYKYHHFGGREANEWILISGNQGCKATSGFRSLNNKNDCCDVGLDRGGWRTSTLSCLCMKQLWATHCSGEGGKGCSIGSDNLYSPRVWCGLLRTARFSLAIFRRGDEGHLGTLWHFSQIPSGKGSSKVEPWLIQLYARDRIRSYPVRQSFPAICDHIF